MGFLNRRVRVIHLPEIEGQVIAENDGRVIIRLDNGNTYGWIHKEKCFALWPDHPEVGDTVRVVDFPDLTGLFILA